MARKVSDNARNAFKMLQGMGYQPHVAAGLVGNLIQESGWNIDTGAVGDSGQAFGAVQWNGPRKRAFKQWASQNGYPETGLGTQLLYLDHEMKTTERAAGEAVRNAGDLRSATLTASSKFWRPGLPHNDKRMRYAEAVMRDAIESGALSGGGGATQLAGGPSNDELDAMARRQMQAQASQQPSNEDLDAMALRQMQTKQPGLVQQAAGAIGDAAEAVGGYAADSARAFVDNASRAFGSAVNEYISGGQRVDPNKVDLSQGVGFLEQEVGGEPYVMVPGLDGSPDQRLPVSQFSGKDYFTQVDPESGRTVVLPRTPDVEENRGLLNAGRMMGLPTAATVPMGTGKVGSAATGAAAQGARAAQRIGVVPSFGMGSNMAGRVASVGSDSLVTGGPFRRDATRAVGEMAGAKENIAATVGTGTEATHAGDALMSGADNFLKVHFKGGAYGPNSRPVSEILFDRLNAKIPADTMIDVTNTAQMIDGFLTQFPNLQSVAKDLGITKWKAWADDIKASGGKLRWSEVRALRTMLGEAVGKMRGPMGDRSEGQIKQIYGALSEDLGAAAKAAGPEAEMAWNRMNAHYARVSQLRDEALDVIFKAKSPEAAYENLLALGKDKGSRANVRKLAELRRVMPAEQWQSVVSTVIRRMGGSGDDFSPAKFLTEWSKLSDPAKDVLFKGRKVPQGLAQALDDIVMVANESKGAEKLINFSNSGANVANAATIVGSAGVASTMDVLNIAMAAVGLGAMRVGAELMTYPPFLRAMRAYVASGGSVGAGKRLTKVVMDYPELIAMPVVGVRNSPTSEAPPQLPR